MIKNTSCGDAHDVQRKAALQLHIGAQSRESPLKLEKFREFEADFSVLSRERHTWGINHFNFRRYVS